MCSPRGWNGTPVREGKPGYAHPDLCLLGRPAVFSAMEHLGHRALGTGETCAHAKVDFRSDPADELICATSMVHEVAPLTRDQKIRKIVSGPACLTFR